MSVRVLFDECVPRPLRTGLKEYDVRTVRQMGWAGKQNGELLRAMLESGITVLVTVDQNLPYQQNLRNGGIAVIVLIALTNRLQELEPLLPELREAIGSAAPGVYVEIDGT